ncbi:unnamed protein product, partial [Prorocentrum cordatum]
MIEHLKSVSDAPGLFLIVRLSMGSSTEIDYAEHPNLGPLVATCADIMKACVRVVREAGGSKQVCPSAPVGFDVLYASAIYDLGARALEHGYADIGTPLFNIVFRRLTRGQTDALFLEHFFLRRGRDGFQASPRPASASLSSSQTSRLYRVEGKGLDGYRDAAGRLALGVRALADRVRGGGDADVAMEEGEPKDARVRARIGDERDAQFPGPPLDMTSDAFAAISPPACALLIPGGIASESPGDQVGKETLDAIWGGVAGGDAARDAAPDQLAALAEPPPREPSPDRSGWTAEDYARESKSKGDAAFKKGDWRDATIFYTRAIDRTPNDEKLYSNRSASLLKQRKFDRALEDARRCASLSANWPKAYFRQGQALRGLLQFDDAVLAFREGKFRDAANPDWDKELEKTEQERQRWEEKTRAERRQKREADMTTELNEEGPPPPRSARPSCRWRTRPCGSARAGKRRLSSRCRAPSWRSSARTRRPAGTREGRPDGRGRRGEPDMTVPYRVVREDGTAHTGASTTRAGASIRGMVAMAAEMAPSDQPWVELRHPEGGLLRWSQGCALLRLKVILPETVSSASELSVEVKTGSLRVGIRGSADPIVEGRFDGKVEPEGENFAWYVDADERPPVLEMCLDKALSELYAKSSYTEVLWLRLFDDDALLGAGLFDADLTDLPA